MSFSYKNNGIKEDRNDDSRGESLIPLVAETVADIEKMLKQKVS